MHYKVIQKLQKETKNDYYQALINGGTAWKLEGSIGRLCMDLLRTGACMLPKKRHRDYYGNLIPSRDDVKKGTTGSYQNSVNYYQNLESWE
jgi:hypothetical protein